MNEMKEIGVFYSYGPHFFRALSFARSQYPNAKITAIVPPGFPHAALGSHAHHILETTADEQGHYTFFSILELILRLRKQRYNGMIVLFDSTKLRMVAAASGARERYCFTPDGRFFPTPRPMAGILLKSLRRRVMGTLRCLRIGYIVYFKKVKRGGKEKE